MKKFNYHDKQMWNYISEYQNLSESFILHYRGLVNWNLIALHQDLSKEFILKYICNDII
jgi:hypothetical protein